MRKGILAFAAAGLVVLVGGGLLATQIASNSGTRPVNIAGYTTITWADLIPISVRGTTEEFSGTVSHEQIAELEKAKQEGSSQALRTDLDGQKVIMDGFLLPIAMEGTSVSDFLLVPFVGACIHVPPPPPNQIVFVHIDGGVQVNGLFDVVRVRGLMQAKPLSTELAQVGYQITASNVDLQD